MSLTGKGMSITFGGVDLTEFVRDWRLNLGEPKAVADNPHAPGTPQHRAWEYANVHAPRRVPCDARDQATQVADERIARVKAAYQGDVAPRTFAYGKTVDDLMAFIADDAAGPLVADFAGNELHTTTAADLVGWLRRDLWLKSTSIKSTSISVKDILRGVT